MQVIYPSTVIRRCLPYDILSYIYSMSWWHIWPPQILVASSTPVSGIKMINQVPRLVRHNTASVEYKSYFQGDLFEKYHPSGARVVQCTTQRPNWVGITTVSISLRTLCVCMLVCMCVCLCACISSVLMHTCWVTLTRTQKTTQITIVVGLAYTTQCL